MRVADAEQIARAGGEPAVDLVLGLLAEIALLRERVDEHDRLLKRDSTNSSLAPSNDPPLTRQQRRARERERAKQQGRKQRGGQPGHEGKTRKMVAPGRLDDHVDHVPAWCGCGHRFTGSDEHVGDRASVGAVNATIMRVSAMLADPWRELRDAVREAQAVHADETSWRLRGETNWRWVAASALMACYRIDPARSQAAAKELLGEDFGSFIITDRYAGYHWLDVPQQQLCSCHANRREATAGSNGSAAPARPAACRAAPCSATSRSPRPPPHRRRTQTECRAKAQAAARHALSASIGYLVYGEGVVAAAASNISSQTSSSWTPRQLVG